LANRVLPPDALDTHEPRYPLKVVFCSQCSLVQLTETVSPEVLFRDYVYFSSVSDTVLAHSKAHADELVARLNLGPKSMVVEVASNDGYLLQYVQAHGVPVLGVEPARNIAAVANDRGVPTTDRFFGLQTATALHAEGVRADALLGNNVLAHVADLNGFVAGAALLLAEGGIVEFEFPYVVDLVDHLEFDTIYHEHLCYFSAHSIDALFARHGLVLTDVQHLDIHGGSLRVTAATTVHPQGRARVDALLAEESSRGVHTHAFYRCFASRVQKLGADLVRLLKDLRANGKRVAAYGASAKGATLLNYFGVDSKLIEYVVDRSPAKQGLFTPGTHLPILPTTTLADDAPDFALLLTWNFQAEIAQQQAEWRHGGGRFIVPVPHVHIV
jgi:hypothetical protein